MKQISYHYKGGWQRATCLIKLGRFDLALQDAKEDDSVFKEELQARALLGLGRIDKAKQVDPECAERVDTNQKDFDDFEA